MANRKRTTTPPSPAKAWPPLFASSRYCADNEPWVQGEKNKRGDGDGLEIFLNEGEGPVPSCTNEDILDFCQGSDLPSIDLDSINITRREDAKAKLTDIEHSDGRSRTYHDRVTAAQLRLLLQQKRFGLTYLPDADRRSIYIADLDPSYIYSLTETAPFHQRAALKDIIWKHVAFETSMRVKLNPNGFPIFRLHLNLPHLALRRNWGIPNKHAEMQGEYVTKRKCIDLSFLKRSSAIGRDRVTYSLYEAQFSLAICGVHNYNWISYVFADIKHNAASPDTTEESALDDEDAEEADEDDEEEESDLFTEDPTASDNVGEVVGQDRFTWDPLGYFLQIFDTRMEQVIVKEWRCVVTEVKRAVISAPSQGAMLQCAEHVFEAIDWNVRVLELIRHLRYNLSTVITEWKRFVAEDGDVCYFSSITEQAGIHLNGIMASFDKLMELEQGVTHIDETCQETTRLLELRMSVHFNRLSFRGHELQHRSSALQHESHQLNLRTSRTAQRTAQTAQKSHETALKNQLTTQTSLTMGAIVGGFGIAWALSGPQQDTFRLNPSPRSFVPCAIAIIAGLKLFAWMITLADPCALMKKLVAWIHLRMSSETLENDIELANVPTGEDIGEMS